MQDDDFQEDADGFNEIGYCQKCWKKFPYYQLSAQGGVCEECWKNLENKE